VPLEDGQPIQILTTRDTRRPDALYVLRHSAAHLLAEAVRRLYPGRRSRSARRSRTASTTTSSSPSRSTTRPSSASRRRSARACRGPLLEPRGESPEEAKRYFAELGEDVQGRARRHRGRPDHLLHAGRVHRPLPRSRTCRTRADQGDQADGPRRRLLARRRAQPAADADLRHGLLLSGRPRLVPRAARGGEAP
jgi:hypothetical protein